jgi:SAM-dependent methyltransferase
VYDIEEYFKKSFDVVLCFGVLYHLRYPQLGLARIRNVLRTGGILLLETAFLLETEDTIIQTDYQKIYPHDRSTWNAFSEPALLPLLEESYLQPVERDLILRQDEKRKIGRIFIHAKAFEGKYIHYCFPDPFLRKHFVPLT